MSADGACDLKFAKIERGFAFDGSDFASAISNGVGMFVSVAHVYWLLDSRLNDLRSVLRVADDGVVVLLELFAVNFGLEHFRSKLDLVTEADAHVFAEKLEDSKQFAVGIHVTFDGGIDAGAEHLLEVRAWHPARRNVVAVWFGPELRVKRQRHFRDVDQIVERVVAVFLPRAVCVHLHETLETDVADTGGHATRLHRQTSALLVAAFDTREATDALLARARRTPVETLLVRTSLHALAVAAALLLVNQHDAVLGALVNGVPRARRKASWIGAMIANSRQVEEPCLVLRQ